MNTQNENFKLTESGIENIIFSMRPFCKIQEGNIMGNTYSAVKVGIVMQKALVETAFEQGGISPKTYVVFMLVISALEDDLNTFIQLNKF